MVFQTEDLRGFQANRSWDSKLVMYYDETNNIRRLKLTELGLSPPSNKAFAIAGIALKPGTELAGWASSLEDDFVDAGETLDIAGTTTSAR